MDARQDYFLPSPEQLEAISMGEIQAMRTQFAEWWDTLGGAFIKRMLEDGLDEGLTTILALASSPSDAAKLESARWAGRLDIILAMRDPEFGLTDKMNGVIETIKNKAEA